MLNERMDVTMTKMTMQAISLSLARERGRGRYGWWEESIISRVDLIQKCHKNLLNGHWLDTINYAAMLMARGI
jgi:hypothetical protein